MTSRFRRVPLLLFLLALAIPTFWLRDETLSWATAVTALAGIATMAVWNAPLRSSPAMTLDEWREQVESADVRHGCTSVSVLLAGLVPAWIIGWQIAGWLEFSVFALQAVTAVSIALVHYVVVLLCFAFCVETRVAPVPPHLRAGLADRPRASGEGGDPRLVAPGFIADLNPDAPTGTAAVAASVAPLRRVLRMPQAAPWKPAGARRLRVREWREVLGSRFFAGLGIVAAMIASGAALGAWRGTGLAVLAFVAVVAAAVSRATRWDWPGEVSLADWFRSERSLVNAQQKLGATSHALMIGSGLVIGGEALWSSGAGPIDLLCGAPLVMIALAVALPGAWHFTLRRSIGQPPAVRAVPEPIRQAVLAVARRREEVVARNAESEEISVVEELAGVPVAPADGGDRTAAPPADVASARESQERVLAELARAASLRSDGPQLVRRVEVRLAQPSPQPGDTDLLVDVAELLFLAFPDRAAALVSALGDALAGPPPPAS